MLEFGLILFIKNNYGHYYCNSYIIKAHNFLTTVAMSCLPTLSSASINFSLVAFSCCNQLMIICLLQSATAPLHSKSIVLSTRSSISRNVPTICHSLTRSLMAVRIGGACSLPARH